MRPPAGRSAGAFTLLELLAAVTLLVILGTVLFQVFDQASQVMRLGNSRQEIFQQARVLFGSLERELGGLICTRDASINVATNMGLSRPFRVYHTAAAREAFTGGNRMFASRDGSDVLSFTAALVGRNTVADSVSYGQTANCNYVCYWLNPGDDPARYEPFVLNRYESYDVESASMLDGGGGECALNVLEFSVSCLDPWANPPAFRAVDWESASIAPTGGRRGPPLAVRVTLKLTDSAHLRMYRLDRTTHASALSAGFTPDDDPIARQFHLTIRLRESR